MDVGGSQLVLGARVSTNASDRRELVADVDAVPSSLGTVKEVLADNGYATGDEVAQLEQRGMEVLVATTAEWRRRYDFRPPKAPRPQREVRADWIAAMRKKMAQPEKSARYRLRQADGGTGVRDRQAGDGFPSGPFARHRQGPGRVRAW